MIQYYNFRIYSSRFVICYLQNFEFSCEVSDDVQTNHITKNMPVSLWLIEILYLFINKERRYKMHVIAPYQLHPPSRAFTQSLPSPPSLSFLPFTQSLLTPPLLWVPLFIAFCIIHTETC